MYQPRANFVSLGSLMVSGDCGDVGTSWEMLAGRCPEHNWRLPAHTLSMCAVNSRPHCRVFHVRNNKQSLTFSDCYH